MYFKTLYRMNLDKAEKFKVLRRKKRNNYIDVSVVDEDLAQDQEQHTSSTTDY